MSFLFKFLIALGVAVGTGCISFPVYKFGLSEETKNKIWNHLKGKAQEQLDSSVQVQR